MSIYGHSYQHDVLVALVTARLETGIHPVDIRQRELNDLQELIVRMEESEDERFRARQAEHRQLPVPTSGPSGGSGLRR